MKSRYKQFEDPGFLCMKMDLGFLCMYIDPGFLCMRIDLGFLCMYIDPGFLCCCCSTVLNVWLHSMVQGACSSSGHLGHFALSTKSCCFVGALPRCSEPGTALRCSAEASVWLLLQRMGARALAQWWRLTGLGALWHAQSSWARGWARAPALQDSNPLCHQGSPERSYFLTPAVGSLHGNRSLGELTSSQLIFSPFEGWYTYISSSILSPQLILNSSFGVSPHL